MISNTTVRNTLFSTLSAQCNAAAAACGSSANKVYTCNCTTAAARDTRREGMLVGGTNKKKTVRYELDVTAKDDVVSMPAGQRDSKPSVMALRLRPDNCFCSCSQLL